MNCDLALKNNTPLMIGLVKVDLNLQSEQALVGRISFAQNTFGGEAFFVPAHEDPSRCQSAYTDFAIVGSGDCHEPSQEPSWTLTLCTVPPHLMLLQCAYGHLMVQHKGILQAGSAMRDLALLSSIISPQ